MNQSVSSAIPDLVTLRLPVLLIHLWTDEASAALLDQIGFGDFKGLHRLDHHLFALRPVAGDSAEVELALDCARHLLAPVIGRRHEQRAHDDSKVAALVLPGEIVGFGEDWKSADDALLKDLLDEPPPLEWNQIYLTGYVASRLEPIQSSSMVHNYRRPSGGAVSIFRLPTSAQSREPWRNPKLLGGRTRFVPRPAIERMISSLAAQPVLRISGPIGCGKSRLAWEVLGPDLERDGPKVLTGGVLWTTLPTLRTLAPPVATDLLQRLVSLAARAPQPFDLGASLPDSEPGALLHRLTAGERLPEDIDLELVLVSALKVCARKLGAPLRLIFDDLPAARPEDLDLVLSLIDHLRGGEDVRFVLIGRSGHAWPSAWSAAPEISVPPLGENPMIDVANGLFDGLTMPEPVHRRFLEQTSGCVFALEEGLVRMIHLRHLRQIYGNFFYGGNQDLKYEPSPRFIQHIQAEAELLGEAVGIRLLSTLGEPVPPAMLAAAAANLGHPLHEDWAEPYCAAGWLKRDRGLWGPSVAFAVPAIALAVASTLEADARSRMRHQLGCVLADEAPSLQALWAAYPLIAGSPEGLRAILSLSRSEMLNTASEGILDGLARELAAMRRRGESGDDELQLLWRALPLARRLGRLERFEEELPRAIELAVGEPRKGLAFASLKTELDLMQGNLKEGEETLRGALKLVMQEEPGRQALVLLQLGRLLMRQDRHTEARTLFEQLLPVVEENGSPAQVASCLFYLGNIALNQDRLEQAEELHQRALELRREEKRLKGVGSSNSALGAVALAQGHYPAALTRFSEAEQILEQHGDIGEVSYALLGRGRVLNRLGEYSAANKPLGRALELRQGQSNAIGESIARLWVATNWLDMGRTEDALQAAREANFTLSMGSGSVQRGDAEQLLGRIQLRRRSFHKARQHFNAALAQYRLHDHLSSVLVTESLQLERAIEEGEESEIRRICALFEEEGEHLRPVTRRELVHYRLFCGHSWLEQLANPRDETDALGQLRAAYWELMRKAAHLPPEMRNRFLFQVEDNAKIAETATRHELSLPEGLKLVTDPSDGASG